MEHRNAKTNKHLRELIQKSPKSIRQLSEELSLSPTTVWKWRNSGRTENLSTQPHTIHRSLTKLEERILVKVRRHLRIPAAECLDLLKPYLPKLTLPTAYRVLGKYGLSSLPKPFKPIGKFPQYLPGFFHLDLAYLPTLGERVTRKYLLVAVDRTTKLIFLQILSSKQQKYALIFLKALLSFCPYKIHHILTDNGKEFAKKFTQTCKSLGVKHKKAKIKHPWTNGQAEITIKLIKQETVWATFYQNYQDLDKALIIWLNNYNLERKLKRLENLTSYQVIKNWERKKPEIFLRKPSEENLRIRYTMS